MIGASLRHLRTESLGIELLMLYTHTNFTPAADVYARLLMQALIGPKVQGDETVMRQLILLYASPVELAAPRPSRSRNLVPASDRTSY